MKCEPCLGIPYSTPIMPERLVVLLLRNLIDKINLSVDSYLAYSRREKLRKGIEIRHLISLDMAFTI